MSPLSGSNMAIKMMVLATGGTSTGRAMSVR